MLKTTNMWIKYSIWNSYWYLKCFWIFFKFVCNTSQLAFSLSQITEYILLPGFLKIVLHSLLLNEEFTNNAQVCVKGKVLILMKKILELFPMNFVFCIQVQSIKELFCFPTWYLGKKKKAHAIYQVPKCWTWPDYRYTWGFR